MKETRFLKYKGQVKIWYDQDADFLEVIFSETPGFMREPDDDSIMERIDEAGNIIGFSVMNVSGFSLKRHRLR
ncbi:DUF2283 domain-containing protein [Oscillatoria acuminata]|uniref:DUF2283 domain-containing protein n=1 Tax=Oscillatoria acuminata PCC 6304 TaxID=56110 RepID=K9TP47_9CYAN|nr:DUF2283 domain-containing protein [Oscillatoria acuminata]AFY84642.1 Protein of unknown function (DUF2283) [Oscillatoria acuminata PCC 6304]